MTTVGLSIQERRSPSGGMGRKTQKIGRKKKRSQQLKEEVGTKVRYLPKARPRQDGGTDTFKKYFVPSTPSDPSTHAPVLGKAMAAMLTQPHIAVFHLQLPLTRPTLFRGWKFSSLPRCAPFAFRSVSLGPFPPLVIQPRGGRGHAGIVWLRLLEP